MTDPYAEGYIGVTSGTLEKRLYNHMKAAKKSSIVAKALNKYDDIEIFELYEGTKEECLTLERKYRPEGLIGWNLVEGGGLPPKNIKGSESSKKISQTLKGRKRTEESRRKQAESIRGKNWYFDPETGVASRYLGGEQPVGWLRGMKRPVT